ncbi:MAG: hypothetical protein CMA63_00745 [Euryarchaeota archaeon]|nr:hypothetical protein [Euryarchaeota archaeon]|tara:strand:+ start:200 stop:661 length:462 start_codon:yes stop_codon:yes gene_type:complete
MSEKGNKMSVLYGSQTGNAEMLAYDVEAIASDDFDVQVAGLDEISLEDIMASDYVIICCSTWGDGEQPDNAQDMFDEASDSDDDAFSGTQFAILALGDTAFDLFCESGKEWDELLEGKGGSRINERIECDVDYEDEAEEWIEETVDLMKAHLA